MVANINAAFYENEVVATINDDGKLVCLTTPAQRSVADILGQTAPMMVRPVLL